MSTRLEDYDYILPQGFIAQRPAEPRDHSRLLVVEDNLTDAFFYELPRFLKPGDLLVLNNSKVIPARLFGWKRDTAGKAEVLLLQKTENPNEWEALVRPARRLKTNQYIDFSPDLSAKIVEELPEGRRILNFEGAGDVDQLIDIHGKLPLPPYIKEELRNQESYQTVYAKERGSAAAPTAGLHFTPKLLSKLNESGIETVEIMLHVGLGTFRPVEEEEITNHQMHSEYFEISEEAAAKVNRAHQEGRRVIAVGTTSARVLEANSQSGKFVSGSGRTDIFIYPGYEWRMTDALITNFHLPKSSLLMMTASFVGRERILAIYQEAIKRNYRFFSFGDAMFLTRREGGK